MYTRLIYLISFVLALSLVGQVQAVSFVDTGDGLWSNPANWDTGVLPTAADWVKISQASDDVVNCTISEGFDAVADRVHIGYQGGDKTLTVDGGTLVISGDDLRVGKECTGILNMISGSIDIARDLDICDNAGTGLVNMFGGTINVADDLELPNVADANSGTLNMIGGTINITDNFDMLEPGPAKVHLRGGTINLGGGADLQLDDPGEFNIGGGTLIINGDALATVQGYIDANMINAYGGPNDVNGTMLLDYDPETDQTMVKAVHKYNPIPADGSIALPDTDKLQWTIDAGTVVNVWFGTTPEWDGATWEKLVNEQTVTSVDMPVDLVPKTLYYWAVDIVTPEGKIYGPIFSFVIGNAPPVVKARTDALTWLDNGSVDVALAGTVTHTDPTTTVWTVVSQPDDPNSPDAVIADAAALNTSVTLSAPGEYVLQLEASDGELTGSDTVTIDVYSDSCEAAKSLPDYVPLVGDLNGDCKVDSVDFALLAEDWLKDNSLTEP